MMNFEHLELSVRSASVSQIEDLPPCRMKLSFPSRCKKEKFLRKAAKCPWARNARGKGGGAEREAKAESHDNFTRLVPDWSASRGLFPKASS